MKISIFKKYLKDNLCEIKDTKIFLTALKELSEREADIFENRFINKKRMTLEELGRKYEVSGERIRQIEVKLLRRIDYCIETQLIIIAAQIELCEEELSLLSEE